MSEIPSLTATRHRGCRRATHSTTLAPGWAMNTCRIRTLVVVLAVAVVPGCASNGLLGGIVRPTSPYERYMQSLSGAGLDETALGRDWSRVGLDAMAAAIPVSTPFSEESYLPPDTPSAVAYRLELARGRRLVVDVSFDSALPARLFVDLFDVSRPDDPRRVAFLEAEQTTFTHEIARDGTYLLRVQPELLRGGRVRVVQRTESSLVFPVEGHTARAVQSFFGAPRNAGSRVHEGIDIFAPRGTPVVAVADGTARTSSNRLGGNVVWLHEGRAGRRYYYAHLDRTAIDGQASVRAGDVLGYVGTTGNAEGGAPHLHFGLYAGRAIDPLPFVQPDESAPSPITAGLDRLGELWRVARARTPLRAGPAVGTDVTRQLPQAAVVRVTGATARAVRVVLPDQTSGYVDPAALARASVPLGRERLATGLPLRESPTATAPVMQVLAEDLQADVLGRFDDFTLVRLPADQVGWVDTGTSSNR